MQLPFFQADVPKDQQPTVEMQNLRSQFAYDWADDDAIWQEKLRFLYGAVSYTHLTLPTICSV